MIATASLPAFREARYGMPSGPGAELLLHWIAFSTSDWVTIHVASPCHFFILKAIWGILDPLLKNLLVGDRFCLEDFAPVGANGRRHFHRLGGDASTGLNS